MSSLEHLKRFENILKTEQYETEILEMTEDSLLPCLIAYLGKDSKNRDRFLKIYAQEQLMGEALIPQDTEPKSHILTTLFELEFPFTFDLATTPQLASLLHFINDQQKITGFGMDEVNNKIYFRYHSIADSRSINTTILLNIIGMIMLHYDVYYKSIEEVACGNMTFDELAQQIIEASKEMPTLD